MSREDILKNKFEFLPYQKFRDSEYMNRFLLMIEQNKQPFFEGISQNKKHESFVLKDDIFYISDGKKSYAFKLDEDFDKFYCWFILVLKNKYDKIEVKKCCSIMVIIFNTNIKWFIILKED